MKLADVWRCLVSDGGVPCPTELEETVIPQFAIDSRAVRPGALFVALAGERTDGHLYLQDAFGRGALAAIAEARAMELGVHARFVLPGGVVRHPEEQAPSSQNGETCRAASAPPPAARQVGSAVGQDASTGLLPLVFIVPDSLTALQDLAGYWRARMQAVVIGITGSVGKTTTKEIVANVLSQRLVTLRSEGNLNNELGLPLTLLSLTPEHQRVVLEMGMYALGEITRLCQLAKPAIGLVTNVGTTHLERMGTVERIAQAKAELVQALPPASEGGVAILNGDDPVVLEMAQLTRARVFTCGLGQNSDLWADGITSEGLEGISFRLHYGSESFHLRLPILGRHSVHTALRGAAVGLVEGLSWTEIITGLQDVRGQLRLMVVPGMRGTMLIDDTYNAGPESCLAALNLLADITPRQRQSQPGGQRHSQLAAQPITAGQRAVAVLGDMLELGAYEEEGHRLVGGRAAAVTQKLIAVGRRAKWMAAEALAGGMSTADVYPVETNRDAIAVLQGLIRPGDVILVKGSRGMAMEAIVDALSKDD